MGRITGAPIAEERGLDVAQTIFGRIIAGEIPAPKVWEDDRCIAIRDIHPQAPVHILVIPREEIATIDDAREDHKALLGHLTWVACELARREGLAADGYRLVWNCRGNGGQEVPHIHLHLLGGRLMKWPPG
ncbi:histidine triad nucleotide-binding protein [Candidatus Poribacteria bacterium]|nr:histidine triad nucleotide-binding protein [Candidatus Poribacteria bacterium]